METVCDEDLWIWHLFVGCRGSQNDLNVIHASPLYLSVTGGEWRPRTFSYKANGTNRTLLYYLADGIYPPFAFFVSPFPDPITEVETTFKRLQEALIKYVERRYAISLHGSTFLYIPLGMTSSSQWSPLRRRWLFSNYRDGNATWANHSTLSNGRRCPGGGRVGCWR